MDIRKHACTRIRTDRPSGTILVFALLVMFLLSFLGLTLLTVAGTEHSMSLNALWYDGALAAAEAGLNQAMDQLSPNGSVSTQAIPVTNIAQNLFSYRSGRRTDAAPQPISFVSERSTTPGYHMGTGTGYNPGGYVSRTYQINATGTGPRNTMREVEARVDLGPVAR